MLIAEAMLQQTRAETVVTRYEEFLWRFPDLSSLARAQLDEVLRSWEGLGYYARARNLHRLARELDAAGAAVPPEREALLRLPGIGDYIASALRAFAFGLPDPPLDANLVRIALRFTGTPGEPQDAAARRAAGELLGVWFDLAPPARLGDALMDLGSGVCSARRPACGRCPLAAGCAALKSGEPQALGVRRRKVPVPVRRIFVAQLVSPAGQAWRPRPQDGLLGGLWEPPHVFAQEGDEPLGALLREIEGWGASGARAEGTAWPMRHAFTHQVWEGEVLRIVAHELPLRPPARWLDRRGIADIAVPRAFRAALAGEGE